MGAALKKGELFKARLLESPAIRDVSFSEFKFVSDESRSFIGYNYKGQYTAACDKEECVRRNLPVGIQVQRMPHQVDHHPESAGKLGRHATEVSGLGVLGNLGCRLLPRLAFPVIFE